MGTKIVPINASTVGFAYFVLILLIATTWGFLESAVSSILAAALLNYYFFPPVRTFTIDDPQNWIALFSFLGASLIASRLSTKAKQRAQEALERQQDLERLYTFSRAILLTHRETTVHSQLAHKLAEIFGFSAVILFDRRAGQFYRAGPSTLEGIDDRLRDAALLGTSFAEPETKRIVTAVRLGADPIASLGLQGVLMADSVLQGVANLVAIGLEQARAQELANQVDSVRQSEQLRATIIDAMAHEFKTPLTLIKAATTSMLASPESLTASAKEQLTIADEEAEHLRELMDNSIELARLDTMHIEPRMDLSDVAALVREVIASMRIRIEGRRVDVLSEGQIPPVPLDPKLVKLALKQLLDNALKYSPHDTPATIRVATDARDVTIDVIDHGAGVAPEDQPRVFERFYRGRAIRDRIPGSGLGLNIARSIMLSHHGDLTMASEPGETHFRMILPVGSAQGAPA